MDYGFQNWLIKEGKDIFGFEREIRPERKNLQDSRPVDTYDIEAIINNLSKHQIGMLLPEVKFVNEVWWGQGSQAVRVRINNWLNVFIERRTVDLNGKEHWVTKKVYQLNHNQYGGKEDAIAHEILQEAERVYGANPDSPKRDFEELEDIVTSAATIIRRTAQDIFIFEGIRKVNENNYIIRLGLRGQGVQRKGQKRVEENHTQITYDPETGLIRLTNYNIESPLGQHSWSVTQTDVDWTFAPTQPIEEITKTISTTLHWY